STSSRGACARGACLAEGSEDDHQGGPVIEISQTHGPSSNGTLAPIARPRPLTIQSFGLTDRGRNRPTNEDQFVNATLLRALWIEQSSVPQSAGHYAADRSHLFVVA